MFDRGRGNLKLTDSDEVSSRLKKGECSLRKLLFINEKR